MNPKPDSSKTASKSVVMGLLWSAMAISMMIRVALGVVAPELMRTFDISPKAMGYILSGWNWSITVGLFFSGWIVDLLGPWISMGVASLVWGISTAMLPLAGGAVSFFIMRVIFGGGQALLVPVSTTSIVRTFDSKQRTTAISGVLSGGIVGSAIGTALTAFLAIKVGWRGAFYWLGTGSLVLTLAWFCWFPHKSIGEPNLPSGDAGGAGATPTSWPHLFRRRSTWGMSFGLMGYLYAYFFFVSWLPAYLVIERHMTIMKSGIVASLPFWIGMIGTLAGGWFADFLAARGFAPMVTRKAIIGASFGASTIFVVAAAYVAQAWLAVTLITLCVGSLRFATGSAYALPMDLAPKGMVGTLTSIQSCFGNVGGLLAPIVTGYVLGATGSFTGALLAAGAMALFGGLCFVFMTGSAEESQPV